MSLLHLFVCSDGAQRTPRQYWALCNKIYQLHLYISDIGDKMSFALSIALSLTLFSNFVIFFYYNEKVGRPMMKNMMGKHILEKKIICSGIWCELVPDIWWKWQVSYHCYCGAIQVTFSGQHLHWIYLVRGQIFYIYLVKTMAFCRDRPLQLWNFLDFFRNFLERKEDVHHRIYIVNQTDLLPFNRHCC